MIVRDGTFDVVGSGGVLVYDARKAAVAEVGVDDGHAARDVRLHLLRPGERFRWRDE